MWRSVVASLALAAPLAATAQVWSARAGFDYAQTDNWAPGNRETLHLYNLNLGIVLGGYLYRPDAFQYRASASYNRLSHEYNSARRVLAQTMYDAQVGLFQHPGSRLQLSLFATRREEDFTLVGAMKGASLSTRFGGTATVTAPERPLLTLGYDRTITERTSSSSAAGTLNVDSVNGEIREAGGVFAYNANYAGIFSDGTYSTDNYATHQVRLDAKVDAGDGWRVSIWDTYYLRDPTVFATVNPRQEINTFSTLVDKALSNSESQSVSYTYSHGLQSATAIQEIERASQRLGYQLRKDLAGEELRLLGTANVSYVEERLGAARSIGTSEAIGSVLFWRPKGPNRGLEARGGASLGFLQPSAADPTAGYGVSGGVSWTGSIDPASVRASYDIGYNQDLQTRGASLTQTATANASRRLGLGTITGGLSASSARVDSSLFGTYMGRSLFLDGAYTWSRSRVQLQAGLTDNVNAALNESLTGDGLLVAPYDTHNRYLLFGAATRLTHSSLLTGQVRFTGVTLPDRPSTLEAEARASIEFNYGALRLMFEDRYTLSGVNGGSFTDLRSNLFMIRLYRAFGTRT